MRITNLIIIITIRDLIDQVSDITTGDECPTGGNSYNRDLGQHDAGDVMTDIYVSGLLIVC